MPHKSPYQWHDKVGRDYVNAFWKKYYEYHIADSLNLSSDRVIDTTRDDAYDTIGRKVINKYGMDTPAQRKRPYLKGIEIFVLHKKRFTSMTLVNPVIGSFNHDGVDAADGGGIMSNVMQIMYETVIYKSGRVSSNTIPGFATIHYDKEPSPLSVFGRGTNTIFGPGGVVDGIGSVIRAVGNRNILGAILAASNTYNNAKKIRKKDVKEELKGIAKEGVQQIGKQAPRLGNSVGAFAIGAGLTAAAVAQSKGTSDGNTGTTVSYPKLDANLYLTATESFNLVSNNTTIQDKVASGLYFKDIGSRKGLSVAQSDVEYTAAGANIKRVYRNKAITNIRKLVTEGYLRISRQSLDVNIITEKATL